VRYGTVGLISNLLGYLFFLVLLSAKLPAVLSTGVTYVTLVGASYLANRRWTFRSDSSHARDVPRFLLAHAVGFIASILAMHVLSAGFHPAIAQLVVISVAAAMIYTVLELVSFGRRRQGDD
jgi:putative flippase GtrA